MSQEYLRPIPISDPSLATGGFPLAGGWARFREVEILSRAAPPRVIAAGDLPPETLQPFVGQRESLAGLTLDQPRLMGILNVTPDSFSDGGTHAGVEGAIAHASAMRADGADLIDIGGESTRPGAAEVPEPDETARILPVIEALKAQDNPPVLSLDTRKGAVARAGLTAGADIVNDVSGLRFDPGLAGVAAAADAPLILMHSIGTPESMQGLAQEAYTDVLLDVYDTLRKAVGQAEAAGLSRDRIMVDPGIGFGKTQAQNLALLKRISLFHGLGCGILLGVSRKGMIGKISGETEATARSPGSAALGLWAVSQGVQMLRVHDINMHKQALALWQAVAKA